jgi:cysteinyl-tRNA synthetase
LEILEKSSGHTVYIDDISNKNYDTLALRYLFLMTKYNVEQNFT